MDAAARSERFLSFRTRHFTRVDYLMHPRAIVGQCITTVDWNGGSGRGVVTMDYDGRVGRAKTLMDLRTGEVRFQFS